MSASEATQPGPLRALLPALLLTIFSVGIAFGSTMLPERTGEMAIVFPAFTDELAAWAMVREAGGMIVAPSRLPNVVVAYAPDTQFQDRIRQLGALFFVAARGLCAPVAGQESTP